MKDPPSPPKALFSSGHLRINFTAIPEKRFRINHFIRVPRVVVIDDQGNHLGEMDTSQALEIATQRHLDLVEVAPMARPPVCKILDYGAFQFRQEKQERKAKAQQKRVELKGIRLTFRMGDHDRLVRQKQALKFLEDGHKVLLEMRLRGRENAHKPLARTHMESFAKELGPTIATETPLSMLGNRLTMIVGKKK